MLTKQLLQNAFLKLLKTVSLHAISIRELCKEAGINRTTFYNHYGSQYDLLDDISITVHKMNNNPILRTIGAILPDGKRVY